MKKHKHKHKKDKDVFGKNKVKKNNLVLKEADLENEQSNVTY